MRSHIAFHAWKPRSYQFITAVLLILFYTPCLSEDGTPSQLSELLEMDINELMDLKVTLPSRNEERQFDSAAAVYVLTQEDIRRSGLTSIPELLRMVPGLHVGQIDNSTLAVSSRSDMVWLSNSMLVLLDGRTLYNPLFGGVYWDIQDTLIQDIERIEIIRGPGGSLWGSNAFDGIINIITKSSKKTNSTLLYGGYGTGDREYEAAIRFGSQISDSASGRVYAKTIAKEKGVYLDADESTNDGIFPPGSDAFDDGKQDQAGFRVDLGLDDVSTLTIQGDIYDAYYHNIRVRPPNPPDHQNVVDAQGGNLIINWNKQSGLSGINLKLFYDYTKRIADIFEDQREIYDIDFQHSRKFERQVLTWGLGYRYTTDDTKQTPMGVFVLDPASLADNLYSAFIQDQVELSKNLVYLTIGSKFEHNDVTGDEYQPTVRLLWKQSTQTTFWSSITRAVRIPSRAELHGKIIDPNIPGGEIVIGGPDQESDKVIASEIGYRSQLTTSALFDLALFNNNYNDVSTDKTNTHGLEAFIKYIFSPDWKLEASYTYHKGRRKTDDNEVNNNRIPKNSFHIRSFWNLTKTWEFDALFYYVSHTDRPIVAPGLQDIRRLDLRLGWNPNKALRTSLSLTNILDYVQGEALDGQRINTGTGRGIFFAVEYSFN